MLTAIFGNKANHPLIMMKDKRVRNQTFINSYTTINHLTIVYFPMNEE